MPVPVRDLDEVLSLAAPAFETLRDARLFITGGTGFFGTWLIESLAHANERLRLGAQATILSRDPEAFQAENPHLARQAAFTFHRGDVTSFEFPTGTFTHVIHAATSSSPRRGRVETPLETISVIVDGTRRVLELSRRSGAKRLLFVSSGAVYGRQPPGLANVPEDHLGAPDCLDPRSSYGHAKRLAEQLCVLVHAAGGSEPVIARAFAFVGPHLPFDAHFAIGNFLRDALAGKPIAIQGDGTPMRSYLYASDLAAWLWTLLAQAPARRAYNVGSERAISIADLARLIGAKYGVGVTVAGTPVPGALPERYVPAARRAADELALRVTVDLEEAIERTASWHLHERHGNG